MSGPAASFTARREHAEPERCRKVGIVLREIRCSPMTFRVWSRTRRRWIDLPATSPASNDTPIRRARSLQAGRGFSRRYARGAWCVIDHYRWRQLP